MRLSCYLLDDVFAVDAGALTTALALEGQRAVRAVALTHGHLDHIWSLPLFLANRFGSDTDTCHLFASTFTMESTRAPRRLASLSDASVSAVSPDWEIPTTSVRSSTIGSRYRNSWARSTSVGMRAKDSISRRPMSPECQEVPHAMT